MTVISFLKYSPQLEVGRAGGSPTVQGISALKYRSHLPFRRNKNALNKYPGRGQQSIMIVANCQLNPGGWSGTATKRTFVAVPLYYYNIILYNLTGKRLCKALHNLLEYQKVLFGEPSNITYNPKIDALRQVWQSSNCIIDDTVEDYHPVSFTAWDKAEPPPAQLLREAKRRDIPADASLRYIHGKGCTENLSPKNVMYA